MPGHIYLAFNLGVLYAQWADSAYELTVTAGAGGSITTPGSPTVNVAHGVPTTITAQPDSSYSFDEWSVTAGTGVAFADSNAASTTVTLDNGNATVLASFVDSQAPAKPVIQVVSDGTVTNQDVVFSITNIETGATVEYTTNNGGDWLSYTIGSDVTIPKGIDTVDTYEIAARQTDGAGNTSPVDPGDYIGVTIDTTAPGAPSVSGDPSPSSEPRPEWTWSSGSGDGNGTFKYKLDSGSYTITVEYYTVYYDGRGHDGGTLPDDSHYGPGDLVTVQSGSSLYHDGLFISELRRRYFVYWNTEPDGFGTTYVPNGAPDYDQSFFMGNSDVILYAIYIGDHGPAGGWLFYDKGDSLGGWRFMEAAPHNTEWENKVWGGYGTDVNGDDSNAHPEFGDIGYEESNTLLDNRCSDKFFDFPLISRPGD